MPFLDEYVLSTHPPLPLHPKVPCQWALDTYSTIITKIIMVRGECPFGGERGCQYWQRKTSLHGCETNSGWGLEVPVIVTA